MTDRRDASLAHLAELGLIAASLGHEFRHAVFAIRSLGQLARRDAEGPAAEHLDRLLESIDHLGELIEAIGVYARQSTLDVGPVDPDRATQLALRLVAARAARRGVSLEWEASGWTGAVRAEATALVQVLVNLLQNAIDASPRGGVVRLRTRVEGAEAWFEVVDRGPGIPAADRERIFEPFYTTKPPGRGTGLGLALVRDLADAMGIRVEVVDALPGTCFRVVVPRQQQEAP